MRFSLIIPTYNRASLIGETLKRALDQSFTDYEVIIVDDGSTDNTASVVAPFLSDKVHYYTKENAERAAARNFGLQYAKGDYVTFLDSDDWIYTNHFEEASKMIKRYQSPEWFHLAYEMRTPEGELLAQYNQRKGDLGAKLIEGNQLSCIGVFVKKNTMCEVSFNETRALSGSEDWEVWLRMASRYPLYYSNTITACMINHEARSVLNIQEAPLVQRIDIAVEALLQDEPFKKAFGNRVGEMWAHLYFYIALHLVMSQQKERGWHYVWKAIKSYFPIIFSKKMGGIIKQSL